MAVLALGFVGSAIGAEIGGTILGIAASTIGGFIGSAVGSMVDNMLFPQKQEGPRLNDLSVQTSTLGNPISLLYGPENRIAGNVIWSSGLKETSHKEKHGGKGGPSVTTTSYTYSASFAVALCEGEIVGIRKIWASGKLIYDASQASGPLSGSPDTKSAELWADMRVYPGSFTQSPDPTIESFEGVGDVQAYRGTAYVVFTDMQLADYGNRLPQLEFLVEKDEAITVGEVLADIVRRCGLDPSKISSSGIEGDVRGYAIGTTSSGTAAIQPLALVFNFDAAQVNGALRFVARGSGIRGLVELDQLAGHAGNDDRPEAITWVRNMETAMPREASLQFRDPDRDYQINSQAARRQAGSAESNLSSQIPVVVDIDTARKLCDRMLWEAWVGRATATTATDDRWINMEAGKVYLFETPSGFLEPLRVRRKTRGANGVIDLELARDRSQVYRSTATGAPASVPVQDVNVPGPTDLFVFDAPLLQDADDNTGFYFIVDGNGPGWRGADVIRSVDDGATYDSIGPAGFQGIIGTIDDLDDGVTEVFDELNVIRVTLADPTDELESVTELDVLNGKNVAWIGPPDGSPGEVLSFRDAVLVSPGVYDLSGLIRGRLGTEWATGLHNPDDVFVKLDGGNLQREDFGPSDWDKERIFKAVSLLTLAADADEVPFTNTGEGKRPLSPVHIVGDNTGADLVITWVRRSRLQSTGLAGPVPLGETAEAYEVELYDGATLLRTIASSTPTVTYLAADQVTDGIAPGDTVGVRVYQLSDVRGRGRPGIAELIA